jgi:tetratricopeptide (TPR) repeat protein
MKFRGNLNNSDKIERSIVLLNEQRVLAKENPSLYNIQVAKRLNSLALLFRMEKHQERAKEAYEEALAIYRGLVEVDTPLDVMHKIAILLSNLALLYREMNNHFKSEEYYQEALLLCSALVKINPTLYEVDLENLRITGMLLFNQSDDTFKKKEA